MCLENQLHLVRVHTHPFSSQPSFSGIDDQADLHGWFPYVAEKIVAIEHASVIFGRAMEHTEGRVWDRDAGVSRPLDCVKAILPDRLGIYSTTSARVGSFRFRRTTVTPTPASASDRTALAMGPGAQKRFRQVRISVVGAGGLGSIAAELLARLPVAEITLIDDDVVEKTNLNRLQGISKADIGRLKVEAVAEHLKRITETESTGRIFPSLRPLSVSLHDRAGETAAIESDIILGCVDSVRARFAMNQLSMLHALPYFDLGTAARAENGELAEAGGQIVFIRPGQSWCLSCKEIFSKRAAAIESLSPEERLRDEQLGYLPEAGPAPSVYALNMQITSTGIFEIMRYIAGGHTPKAWLRVDAVAQKTDSYGVSKNEGECLICGRDGALGLGENMTAAGSNSEPDTVPECPTEENLPEANNNR